MKIIITLLFCLTGSFSFAQDYITGTPPPIEWGVVNHNYPATSNLNLDLYKIPDREDNACIVGNGRTLHIIEGETGAILQTSTATEFSGFTHNDIKPTLDGGFIRLARVNSFTNVLFAPFSLTGYGGQDAVLLKYDSELEIEWIQNYGGSGADFPESVIQTSDGGYLFVGYTTSIDGQLTGIKNFGSTRNWYIVKTDSLGLMQWTKTYGGNDNNFCYNKFFVAEKAIELASGGYIVAGTMASMDGDVLSPLGCSDIWVLKLDEQGSNEGQWQRNLGGSNYDIMYYGDLKELPDGNIVLSGLTNSADGEDVENFMGGDGDNFIVKLNSETGNTIWAKTIGGYGYEGAVCDIEILPDGNIIIAPSISASELELPGFHPETTSMTLLTKMDSNTGDYIWDRLYGSETGAAGLYTIIPYPDGSILLHGVTTVGPTGPDFDPSFTTYSDEEQSGKHWILKLGACPLFTTADPVAICEGGSYDFYGTEITETGTYTHTIEGENCDEIVTLTVTVNPLPELSVETPAVTICEGETTELTATAAEGVTVNWYATADATEVLHTGSTYTTPPLNNSTTYFVEAVSEAECASARTEVVVTVNPRPELSVEAASVCEGNSTELTATVAEGVTVNWYATADATEILFTGATYTTPELTESTTYYVEAVSSESCKSERLEVTVTVNPLPELTVTQTVIEVCEGNPVVLTADVETGNMAIWYDSEEATQWIGTGEEFSIEDLEPGTYSYWAQAYNPQTHCVSERIEVSVTVLPAPVLEAETAYTICEGNDAVLYAYSEGNVIFWYENQDDTEYLYHGNNFIIEGLAEGTHTYWVEAYTVETGCASERTEVTVTVNPVPDAPIVVEVYQAEPGQTLADLEEDIEAEGELTWYADAALTTELPNTTVVEDGAVYYVTQTVNGCESEAAAVNVEMLGTSDVNSDDFAYYPNPVSDKLNFTGSDKVESVQIYDLNGRLLLNQNGQDIRNVNVAQLSAGTYIVRAKAGKEVKTFKIIKK